MLHIIHSDIRRDRYESLISELKNQNITEYKLWPAILTAPQPYVGIAQAHKQIIRYAQNQKQPFVVIAEDDIKFTSRGAYEYYLSNLPKSFDLFLGGITSGILMSDNRTVDFSGLTLYTIHQRFYSQFLNTPETANIDRLLKNKGIYYVCNPFVAIQHNGYSDNRKEFCNYDSCYLNRLLYSDEYDS